MTQKKKVTAKPRLPNAAPVIGGGPGNMTNEKRNPPPDGRMFRPLPFAGPIARGYITEHQPPGPGRCYFMYNPNQLSYSFEVAKDLVAPDATASVPTNGPVGGTTVSLSLLFVRQFEVAYGRDTKGVWRDIDALRYLIGITDPDSIGFGWTKTLMFVFGADHSMVFYGAITSMSVTLTLFSEKMVPMAAEVVIGASWMPAVWDGVVAAAKSDTSASGVPSTAVAKGAAPGGTRSGQQP